MMLVSKAPAGSIIWAVRKSQKSISDIPNRCMSAAPTLSEQKTAMTLQTAVSMQAALRRLKCSSSWKNAVPISCMEMVLVRAANTSRA